MRNYNELKLDAKQKVLLAIYTEQQKNSPCMDNINPFELGISNDVFKVAVMKLDNEQLIKETIIHRDMNSSIPLSVNIECCKLTESGHEYVELFFSRLSD